MLRPVRRIRRRINPRNHQLSARKIDQASLSRPWAHRLKTHASLDHVQFKALLALEGLPEVPFGGLGVGATRVSSTHSADQIGKRCPSRIHAARGFAGVEVYEAHAQVRGTPPYRLGLDNHPAHALTEGSVDFATDG